MREIFGYKNCKPFFERNRTFHFGNVSGTDDLKGEDICIVGTYRFNEVSYFLDAFLLDIDIDSEEELSYQLVNFKGKEFYFFTYSNPELRNIHLLSIESESKQAVGRARIVREDCTVFVLSNFPLDGAEYRKITDDYEVTFFTDDEKKSS